jgi:hypothetical protein
MFAVNYVELDSETGKRKYFDTLTHTELRPSLAGKHCHGVYGRIQSNFFARYAIDNKYYFWANDREIPLEDNTDVKLINKNSHNIFQIWRNGELLYQIRYRPPGLLSFVRIVYFINLDSSTLDFLRWMERVHNNPELKMKGIEGYKIKFYPNPFIDEMGKIGRVFGWLYSLPARKR